MVHATPESIERFIEGHASLRSYDSAPRPPPPTRSPVSKLDRRHTGRLRKSGNLLTAEERGVWPWSRIIRSLALSISFNPLCAACIKSCSGCCGTLSSSAFRIPCSVFRFYFITSLFLHWQPNHVHAEYVSVSLSNYFIC